MINNKLSSVNLNLLNTLDVLLELKNTTYAAEKLHVSQPAVSLSLKQLREIFKDDLLVKDNIKKVMTLTPQAKLLIRPLRKIIEQMELVLFKRHFVPEKSNIIFNIAMGDVALLLFVPKLLKKISAEAPGITVNIKPFNYNLFESQIEDDFLDLAVGCFETSKNMNTLSYEHLATDRICCIAAKGHPILEVKTLSLKNFQKYPKIVINFPKAGFEFTYEKELDFTKEYFNDNTVYMPSNLAAFLAIMMNTDRIALGGEMLFKHYSKIFKIGYTIPEFNTSELNYSLCYHTRNTEDESIQWVISIIKEIALEL